MLIKKVLKVMKDMIVMKCGTPRIAALIIDAFTIAPPRCARRKNGNNCQQPVRRNVKQTVCLPFAQERKTNAVGAGMTARKTQTIRTSESENDQHP
ncbi:MAG: hypothetical protein IJJ85_03240 [Clostridia bacterium]|nr:hypothetical protein [Clostridia bacterium]